MSDAIKHECGIALLRLKKPLRFYSDKYGTPFYGLNRMYILMEKEHHRGQDGAGLANIKLDPEPGRKYISRIRSTDSQPVKDVFARVMSRFAELDRMDPSISRDPEYLKQRFAFTGEVFLGHLRYGTYGGNSVENCHPFLRQNNWMTRNLVLAGNFNLTNVDELFGLLLELGQYPKEKADTVTVMEKIGHFLDEENQDLFAQFKAQGYSNREITGLIIRHLDIRRILERASREWDGGYAMAGMFGHGDAFVLRDPNGIRPAYFFEDDEVSVVASERPPIQSAFNVPTAEIRELEPGHAYIIRKDGRTSVEQVREPQRKASCTFERIYFSRGNDRDIYRERQQLGKNVVPLVLREVNHDLENTVFSFIPNTAETAFYGMIKALEDYLNDTKLEEIRAKGSQLTQDELERIIRKRARIEKIALKDVRLRTFITQDSTRDEMVSHVYDITHGALEPGKDSLVVLDDSIVRGTTLRGSLIRILNRLRPRRIIIVSSAPQIRYPDCYGIDMARMGDFIAFQAAVSLLRERGMDHVLEEVYRRCRDQDSLPKEQVVNCVKDLYAPFSYEEISSRISALITPPDISTEVRVVFQTIEGLRHACPLHSGDWYFTGDYPTPGGTRVANKAFINFMEHRQERAY